MVHAAFAGYDGRGHHASYLSGALARCTSLSAHAAANQPPRGGLKTFFSAKAQGEDLAAICNGLSLSSSVPHHARSLCRALDEMIRLSPTNKDSGSFKEDAHRLACARMLICACNCMRVRASYGVRARARACVCVFACACVCARAMCACAYVHAMCFVLCACCACVHARVSRRTHRLKPLLVDGAFQSISAAWLLALPVPPVCG